MRIDCPFCGLRDHSEFQYGGDASKRMPMLEDTSWVSWYDYVYVRSNPCGEHIEYWHHVHGCRHWLRVVRDTLTHEVKSCVLARDGMVRGGGDG